MSQAIVDEFLRSLNSRFEGIFEIVEGGSCIKNSFRFYSACRSAIKKRFEDFVYLVRCDVGPKVWFLVVNGCE